MKVTLDVLNSFLIMFKELNKAAWEGVSPSTYSRLALQRQVKQDLPELMTGGA